MSHVNRDEPDIDEEIDDWDFEHPIVFEPVEAPGAVVAVRFEAADFERVARQAESEGIPLIDFIRDAAIERADRALPFPQKARHERRVG